MHWMMMPLKRYAEFSGRSRRMEFWMWQVFKFLVGCVFMIVMFIIFGATFATMGAAKDPNQVLAAAGGLILVWMVYMLFGLAILVPDIAVMVRRLHDTNRSGWWILAPIGCYFIGVMVAVVAAGAGVGMGPDTQAGTGLIATGGIIGLIAFLAALVFAIVLLVFWFLDGTPGPNKYGPDPKGRDASQVFA